MWVWKSGGNFIVKLWPHICTDLEVGIDSGRKERTDKYIEMGVNSPFM